MKKPSSPKERNLIKGAIRRVFSRSELRKQALDRALVKDYHDPSRKRVTRWGRCASCSTLTPLYLLEIDHNVPIVPTDSTLEAMTWDEVIDRTWCDERNLQALCEECHKNKTSVERKERLLSKKERKAKK